MTIVFIIVKGIGILLAALISLFLLLCLLVLFVPIRYSAYVIYQERLQYGYRLHWCIRFVSLQKKINSNRIRLYVLGIPIRTIAGEDEVETTVGRKFKKGIEKVEEPLKQDHEPPKKEPTKQVKQKKQKKQSKQRNQKKQKKKSSQKQDNKKKKSRFEKLRFHFRKISSIIKFIRNQENKKVISMLWREFMSLLQHTSPKTLRGEVRIGTGDPAFTGIILGGISLFPWAYKKDLIITPDFEETILRGELAMKGRIRLSYIAGLAWRLYHNRELKKTINKWKNI